MRYVKIEDNKLYTPILKHRKGGLTVTNIGVVHMGTKEYYRRVQVELDKIPFGFFELIRPLSTVEKVPSRKREYYERLKNSKDVHERIADYFGLVAQPNRLKYPDSWKNPGISLEKLASLPSKKSLEKLCRLSDILDGVDNYYGADPKKTREKAKKLFSLISRFPFLYKTFLYLNFKSNNTRLDRGNQRLFKVMESELDDSRHKEIGTIYGSAHLEGIDTYLRNKGFKKEDESWIPAWDL